MIRTYRTLLALLSRRDRRRFGLLLGLSLLSALLDVASVGLMLPFLRVLARPGAIRQIPPLRWAQDAAGFGSPGAFSFALGLAVLALLLAASGLRILTLYALTRFGAMQAFALASRLLRGSLHQPYAWFLTRHSARLGAMLLTEVDQLVTGTLLTALQLLPHLMTAGLLATAVLVIEPAIALAALALLGGAYLAIYLGLRPAPSRLGRQHQAANARRFHVAQEAAGGVKEVKLMGLEEAFATRFDAAALRTARLKSQVLVLNEVPRHAVEAIALGGIVAMILALMLRGQGGLAEVLPILGFTVLALGRLLPALQQVYSKVTQIRFNDAVLEGIRDELAALPHVLPPPEKARIRLKQSLTLDRVTYRYPGGEAPALAELSLTIPACSSLGIVGGTGAGKSTLLDLLLGLLAPQSGTLSIDGQAVKDPRAWQASIGYVPQTLFLADDTLAANIAFGLPAEEVDTQAVRRAARLACLDGFVERELPQGYATPLGERGLRLSGGQRQRVGIARALYRDPDVLVLDEATSALDSVTEAAVMDALRQVAGQKTLIMVAHRLSTVRGCDRIILMEGGRVRADGRYEELLATSPAFRALAQLA